MGMGHWTEKQKSMWVRSAELARGPGHPFYEQLNRLLSDEGFDAFVEELCERYYEPTKVGRPSIAPGVYFRMLLVGYFEGLESERAIDWRCADSRSLGAFLGLEAHEATPDHSTLSLTRRRFPEEVFDRVFTWVLGMLEARGLVKGRKVGIDSTTIRANASMRKIKRKWSGKRYREYVRALAAEDGVELESEEDLRRYDRRRPKRTSNREWESETDPEARIARMKSGDTQLAYKPEHAVDLETDVLLAAEVHPADEGDAQTGPDTLLAAVENVEIVTGDLPTEDVVLDKGYESTELIEELEEGGFTPRVGAKRVPKKKRGGRKTKKSRTLARHRRRSKTKRSRKFQRLRAEKVERSIAHVCETGGGRRTHLRGRINVQKQYWMRAVGYNLSCLMRAVVGYGTPRALQQGSRLLPERLCGCTAGYLDPGKRRLDPLDHSRPASGDGASPSRLHLYPVPMAA
jgi:transposase